MVMKATGPTASAGPVRNAMQAKAGRDSLIDVLLMQRVPYAKA